MEPIIPSDEITEISGLSNNELRDNIPEISTEDYVAMINALEDVTNAPLSEVDEEYLRGLRNAANNVEFRPPKISRYSDFSDSDDFMTSKSSTQKIDLVEITEMINHLDVAVHDTRCMTLDGLEKMEQLCKDFDNLSKNIQLMQHNQAAIIHQLTVLNNEIFRDKQT